MELSPRKQAVLAAVTKAYIATGEPVGSKTLAAMLKNAPSSATLRNEMSELCELGLLSQPHTSAGRVPTSSGFRTYIDTLMKTDKISETDRAFIDRGFGGLYSAPEEIPDTAAEILTSLTGLPALTCFFAEASPKVRRVELIPVTKGSVLLLLITTDGRTRSRIFRPGAGYDRELDGRFAELIKKRVESRQVDELTKAYMQGVIAEAGIDSLRLMPLLSAVFEMADGIGNSGLRLSGRQALYNICGSDEKARSLLSFIELEEPMLSVMRKSGGKSGVIFGSETGYRQLADFTVVSAGYSIAGKYSGSVAVIGPNRISYERIIPVVEYTASRLSALIAGAQKDMED